MSPSFDSATVSSGTEGGSDLVYTFDAQGERPGIAELLKDVDALGIRFKDLNTTQSSLEDIFVSLVRERQ